MNLRNLSKNIVLLFLFLTLGEVLARYLVDYNSNFYALPKRSKFQSINIHPYGQVPVNSKGHFDKEWNDPKTIKRYAYSGDSVVYGTGAGFPFRITEYLDDLEPDFEHINVNSRHLDAKENLNYCRPKVCPVTHFIHDQFDDQFYKIKHQSKAALPS